MVSIEKCRVEKYAWGWTERQKNGSLAVGYSLLERNQREANGESSGESGVVLFVASGEWLRCFS